MFYLFDLKVCEHVFPQTREKLTIPFYNRQNYFNVQWISMKNTKVERFGGQSADNKWMILLAFPRILLLAQITLSFRPESLSRIYFSLWKSNIQHLISQYYISSLEITRLKVSDFCPMIKISFKKTWRLSGHIVKKTYCEINMWNIHIFGLFKNCQKRGKGKFINTGPQTRKTSKKN